MWGRQFKPGDVVVYRKTKRTTHPGRRAQGVRAAPRGDDYAYFVEKLWVVRKVQSSGGLVVQTRRGKTHVIDQSDPNLHQPTLWQRIRYRSRVSELRHLESPACN